jgi:hypothetical protein
MISLSKQQFVLLLSNTAAADCPDTPGPATDNFPANAAWSCSSSTAPGGTCSAACNPVYTPAEGTSWQSVCSVDASGWGNPGPQLDQRQLECLPKSELS